MGCRRQRDEAGPSPLLKGDAQALCSGNPESIILAIRDIQRRRTCAAEILRDQSWGFRYTGHEH